MQKKLTLFRHNFSNWNRRVILSIHLVMVLLFIISSCNSPVERPSGALSEKEFLNPSTQYRPLALWTWLNGYVDTTQMVYELEEMKDKGMRGALIWDLGALIDPDNIIPEGPEMLGRESLGYFSQALKTAEKLDLDLGWVASSSWNAGGPWVAEADAAKELTSSSQFVKGPSKQKITIPQPQDKRASANRFTLLTALAIPQQEDQIIDYEKVVPISLDEYISEDRQHIDWEIPEGQWEILSFFMSNTGQELVVPSPQSSGLIIDHLSESATKNYFDSIYQRLESIQTPDRHLKFFMLDSYEVWPSTDWSPAFIEAFRLKYEYDPVPYLPLLKGFKSKDEELSKRFLGDYRRLVSDMMIENHFAQSVEIAEKQGVEMVVEAGHGGYPRVDPLKALGHSHIPMGEFWNRQRHWVTKEAASAAHIYGKKLVAAVSLTGWNHWQHGPADFKQLIDIAFCEGLNQVVFHTFSHNPKIAGKPGFVYHAGEHINVNATWWEMARPFMDYIARGSYMLRQGNNVADVLLYYGDEAPNLVPPKRLDPNYTPDMPGLFPDYFYDDSKCPHCGIPKPINPGKLPGYEYDYVNEDIITTTLETKNGELILPHGQTYKVMVLPDRVAISLEVLKHLEKLVLNGAVVIGRKPERSTSLKGYPECDQEVKMLADKIWGESDGQGIFSNAYGKGTVYWGKSINEVLDELSIVPDFEVKGIDNHDLHVDYIHRKTENEDIYFVSNSSQKQEKISAVFRVEENQIPELWDAETGLVQREVTFSKVKKGIELELTLDPLASRFVVFRKNTTGKNDTDLFVDLQFGQHKNQGLEIIHPPLDLSNDWTVKFNTNWGGPQSLMLDSLISWSDMEEEGAKYYSGTAGYSRDFVISEDMLGANKEAFVTFENIQEMAQVFVNGNDCGTIWLPPYTTRITPFLKGGTNTITVKVINTWNNRIVGDAGNEGEKRYTQTNAIDKFSKESLLLPSGLLGKSRIYFISK